MENEMELAQVKELVLQSLEHERGGVKLYEVAVQCAVHDDLKQEWQRYLEETKTHVAALEGICKAFGIHRSEKTPGCAVVHYLGSALVQAIKMAQSAGDAAAAQLVACECVVSAELKDHLNWELLGRCGEHLRGEQAKLLSDASERFSAQEGEHLYRTKSRCRDLWIQSLGILQAVPPPLEEKRYLELAIGIARAEQASADTRERRRSAH